MAKMPAHASANGLAFITQEEGLVLHPYNDSQGYATVFVGHLIAYRGVQAHDWTDWRPLDRPHAIRTLAVDVGECERAIHAHVQVDLNPNEFDALCSIAFNIGTGGFASSTFLRRLNAGDRKGAADAFLMWDRPSVLLPRRKRERALFLTPYKDPKPDPYSYLTGEEAALVKRYKAGTAAQRKQLKPELVRRRKQLYALAQPRSKGGDGRGWSFHHRLDRYHIFRSLTQ